MITRIISCDVGHDEECAVLRSELCVDEDCRVYDEENGLLLRFTFSLCVKQASTLHEERDSQGFLATDVRLWVVVQHHLRRHLSTVEFWEDHRHREPHASTVGFWEVPRLVLV